MEENKHVWNNQPENQFVISPLSTLEFTKVRSPCEKNVYKPH